MAGVLAFLCIGLASGAGFAGAEKVQAKAHETVHARGFRSGDTSSQRVLRTMWSSMIHTARMDGSRHQSVSFSPPHAGTIITVPVLMKALPSSSTYASSAGTTATVTRGHGDAFSPASQAHSMLASSVLSHVWRVPDIPATQALPSLRGVGLRDSVGTRTRTAQVALTAGPQGQLFGLGVNLLPDRSDRLSLLSLERVLDRQTFAPVTTVSIAGSRSEPAEDLALTARRPAVADGLRMVGVHPAATQYLRATTNTHSTSSASGPGLSKASIIQPVTPTRTTASPATWTAATMPGGNASLYLITGYTWTGGTTATGTYPHWGTVAVDPNVIPLGSTVYIQGLGVFHAEDTGGAVIGQHVDVFVDSAAEAYQLTGYRLVSFIPPSS